MDATNLTMLLCQAPGRVGVLIRTVKGERKIEKTMRFKDGRAAMAWCEKRKVVFVYFTDERPTAPDLN